MKNKIIAGLILSLLSVGVFGQSNFVLHNFSAVPQNYMTNPAMRKTPKFVIGVPLISSFQLNFLSSTYKPSDVLTADESELNIEGMLEMAKDKNYFSANIQEEILFVGFKISKAFISFGISNETELRFDLPIDLLKMIWYGNGDPQFMNKEYNMNQTNIFLNSYIQYHLGVSVDVTDNLTIGARAKYLNGLANIQVEEFNASIITKDDPISIYAIESSANLMVNTSCLNFLGSDDENSEEEKFDIAEFLLNSSNKGMAFDIGAQYNYKDKFYFAASIIDLGSINWTSKVKNYKATDASFTFDGVHLSGINDTTDVFQNILDDIDEEFSIEETENVYSTRLTTKVYLSGSYIINRKNQIDALFFGRIYSGNFKPAVSLGYYCQLSNAFGIKATYSIIDGNFLNIGVGASLKLGPLQLYTITDNLQTFIDPWNSKTLNLRFGLNINVGKILERKVIVERVFDEEVLDEEVLEEKIPDEEVPDEEVLDEEVPDEEVLEEKILDEEVPDEKIPDEEVLDEEVPEEEVLEENILDEEILDEEVPEEEVLEEEVLEEEVPEEEVLDEEVPEEEVLDEEVPEEKVLEEKVPDEEVLDEEVPEEEVLEEEVLDEEVLEEEVLDEEVPEEEVLEEKILEEKVPEEKVLEEEVLEEKVPEE